MGNYHTLITNIPDDDGHLREDGKILSPIMYS